MQPKQQYELKFGERTVSVRRIGSAHVHSANILGQEVIAGTDLVRIWLDRHLFDGVRVEQEGWSASGAVSTVLEVSRPMMEVPQHDS